MTTHSFETLVGDRLLTIETGKLAHQANGAVTVRYGDTMVLVTACASEHPREGVDFFPLTVDYEERLYAAGKIPGGRFIKREGRPSEDAVLAMRLTDRALRPLFPRGFRNDVQVIVTTLSADMENDPDILALIGASAALGISDIPFAGPVGATRVGYVDGQYVVNPSFSQLEESQLDLVVAGTRDRVVMLEAGANQVEEDVVEGAIRLGQEVNADLIGLQEELIAAAGREKLPVVALEPSSNGAQDAVAALVGDKLDDLLVPLEKLEREDALAERREELVERLSDEFSSSEVRSAFDAVLREQVRRNILERGLRPDGRRLDEIRPLFCEVGLLPRTHGSGLFVRGETQVLTITTLGSPGEELLINGITPEESKRFLHHYNFPPFSVGETRRLGAPGRREIGHGALAEKALRPVIPDEERFPYTLRLVSEVLSSNGSTSMASVCASTLSLMDAGVPIAAPVAGISIGLITGDEGEEEAVLTDIQGMEDAVGDMDFKVAGTRGGITAIQLDVKVHGISMAVVRRALEQARQARFFILDRMAETISVSRQEISQYAPRMYKIHINPDKIRVVIGPGGKMIRSIIDQTKCTIDVEDDGTVVIGSASQAMAEKAIEIIEGLTRDVEVGEVYTGKVTRLMNFGAFVEVLPGKEGLVPIGELADYRVPSVEDVVQVGDEIMVMVVEIDHLGRINLSRRAVLEGQSPEEARAGAERRRSARSSPRDRERPPRRPPRGGLGGGPVQRPPRVRARPGRPGDRQRGGPTPTRRPQ